MNVLALFQPIKVFVFDIDGVLTEGNLLIMEDGNMLRTMNVKDGYAMALAVHKGYELVIISGGYSEASKIRLQQLGIEKVFIGVEDKAVLLRQLMTENNWQSESMMYMGDDIPDINAMKLCGLITCPLDAAEEIIAKSHYVSPKNGGKGCVRDVIEKTLKLRGDWPETWNY